MIRGPRYYYRGTTLGWPGSVNLVENCVTFASTDPMVATLFAIECRSRGEASVLVVARRKFEVRHSASSPIQGPVDLSFTHQESAVELAVLPSDYERNAELIVSVDSAIGILRQLGFETLPVRIGSRSQLDELIRETYNSGQRLTPRQIAEFEQRIQGLKS